MPLIKSDYRPPPGFANPHVQTVWAGKLRRVRSLPYRRERIHTPDGDFLDLDWLEGGFDRLVIISHGLEGSSSRSYVQGMGRALHRRGWDVLAWNLRGCSGEQNHLLRTYHSGDTADLDEVVRVGLRRYNRLALVGFSLGGNITLKYLGEEERDERIRAAAAFSVPVDLASSSIALARWSNAHYMGYFLRRLRRKVRLKAERFPDEVDLSGIRGIRSFRDFDDAYTAPVHGFRDAEEYWARSSSLPHLSSISIPSLLVNAADDPFLAPACYPIDAASRSEHLFLEVPEAGGHVAFVMPGEEYYSELRAAEFLDRWMPDRGPGRDL